MFLVTILEKNLCTILFYLTFLFLSSNSCPADSSSCGFDPRNRLVKSLPLLSQSNHVQYSVGRVKLKIFQFMFVNILLLQKIFEVIFSNMIFLGVLIPKLEITALLNNHVIFSVKNGKT